MSVTSVHKDPETLTMTVTADFDAVPGRVWQVWEDPRQLERWWGPPTYPATVLDHDLTPGGQVTYLMTGPDGEQPRGWWRIGEVEAPRRLTFEDGFADADGRPMDSMPTTSVEVTLQERGDGTRMAIATVFPSLEAMEQMVAMGMEQGITEAVGQIDGLLAGAPAR